MADRLLKAFGLRCRHSHYSWPFAIKVRGKVVGHYVVCNGCKQPIRYEWAKLGRVQ